MSKFPIIPIITLIILIIIIIVFNILSVNSNKEKIIKLKQKIKELDGGSEDVEIIYQKYLISYNTKYQKAEKAYSAREINIFHLSTSSSRRRKAATIDQELRLSLDEKELIVYDIQLNGNDTAICNMFLFMCVIVNLLIVKNNHDIQKKIE